MRIRTKTKSKKKNGKIQFQYIEIRELLDNLNIGYTEEGKNVSTGWIGTSCPFCSDESNHLGINLQAKTVSCFKCGETGTILKYLVEELGSFNKAISLLADAVPRELRLEHSINNGENNVTKVLLPKEADNKITRFHSAFLKQRGYNPKTLTGHYNLQFCRPFGKWANRIIVPVVQRSRLVTFTSVDISDETNIRYKHLSDELSIIPIKNYLFGLEYCQFNSVIIVEGLFDQFRFGDGCVATFGTKVTAEQKRLLSKFGVVKICFDGDEAGRIGATKLGDELAPFTDVRIFDLPEGVDPDKLEDSDIKIIKNS
jgi:DNA primase